MYFYSTRFSHAEHRKLTSTYSNNPQEGYMIWLLIQIIIHGIIACYLFVQMIKLCMFSPSISGDPSTTPNAMITRYQMELLTSTTIILSMAVIRLVHILYTLIIPTYYKMECYACIEFFYALHSLTEYGDINTNTNGQGNHNHMAYTFRSLFCQLVGYIALLLLYIATTARYYDSGNGLNPENQSSSTTMFLCNKVGQLLTVIVHRMQIPCTLYHKYCR